MRIFWGHRHPYEQVGLEGAYGIIKGLVEDVILRKAMTSLAMIVSWTIYKSVSWEFSATKPPLPLFSGSD
jgi:hypothetical protein